MLGAKRSRCARCNFTEIKRVVARLWRSPLARKRALSLITGCYRVTVVFLVGTKGLSSAARMRNVTGCYKRKKPLSCPRNPIAPRGSAITITKLNSRLCRSVEHRQSAQDIPPRQGGQSENPIPSFVGPRVFVSTKPRRFGGLAGLSAQRKFF